MIRVRRVRGHSLLLEIIVGLLIILGVILVVATLFPSAYQGSLQAARMTAAVNLAREVLERQKSDPVPVSIGNQTVDGNFSIQGRPVQCQLVYRVDRDCPAGADPVLWKVTVQWENTGQVREVVLVGAAPPR